MVIPQDLRVGPQTIEEVKIRNLERSKRDDRCVNHTGLSRGSTLRAFLATTGGQLSGAETLTEDQFVNLPADPDQAV